MKQAKILSGFAVFLLVICSVGFGLNNGPTQLHDESSPDAPI